MPSVVWAMGKVRAWQVNAAGPAAVKASEEGAAEEVVPAEEAVAGKGKRDYLIATGFRNRTNQN